METLRSGLDEYVSSWAGPTEATGQPSGDVRAATSFAERWPGTEARSPRRRLRRGSRFRCSQMGKATDRGGGPSPTDALL
jgi:hypothetical protein